MSQASESQRTQTTKILTNTHLLTQQTVFTPRYHDKRDSAGNEWICLIPCYKIDAGTPWQILKFTKAKHLLGRQYCLERAAVQRCEVAIIKSKQGTDVRMYEIPEHLWTPYDTVNQIREVVEQLWPR